VSGKLLYLLPAVPATLVVVEIREVQPDEYEEAGRVTALAYQEFAPPGDLEWDAYLRELADVKGRAGRSLVLVAVEGGRVLGTATMEFDDRTLGDDDRVLPPEMASLRMLGVEPSARGLGIGRALVDACIRESRARGKTLFVLRTTELMTAAHGLYESMGFERDAERDLVFEDGFRLLAYRLPIGREAAIRPEP
jgi:ribosomal protein S18 acetylase RimI-like enzyme